MSDIERSCRPNWVEVDKGAITANIASLHRLAGPEVKLFAALKGNACGLGLVKAAATAAEAGADGIGMVDLGEAIALRQHGIKVPIVLYAGGVADADSLGAAAAHDLMPTVHDRASADAVATFGAGMLRVFVEVNAGGERFGFPPEAAPDEVARLAGLGHVEVAGIYAHLNVPDNERALDLIGWAYQRFQGVLGALDERRLDVPIRMVASSKVLALTLGMCLNAIDPGHVVFGLDPGGARKVDLGVRSAFRALKSRLITVWSLARTEFAEDSPVPVRDGLRVGVIPFGNADGLNDINCGQMLVRGRRANLLGPPTAEHARIDLTGVADAAIGDEVVIIGRQGEAEITIEEVGRARGGTRPSVITRRIPAQFQRTYV